MIQMNGAGVGAGVTRAGTICPDPEPPAHFTRAGAGAGIVPPEPEPEPSQMRTAPHAWFSYYQIYIYFYFDVLFFIHFGQVVSSTLSRSDGSQCCCTNAVALHARHYAHEPWTIENTRTWTWTIENTRIFLVTLPSLSLTRYRYLSCMCTAMPITRDWHWRSCAAAAKFCVLKSHNYKTGWILLIPNGPSF